MCAVATDVHAHPLGMFGPGTVTWRVNRETALLAGGGAALLLQLAHPLVAAGVEQHSNYARDPWGRLFRTLDITTKIVFGAPEVSADAASQLQRRHVSVNGTSDAGTPYDARDPELLLWVWATLVHTAMQVHGAYFRPLSDADRARYYEEQKRFAYACGIPEQGVVPESVEDFRNYWQHMLDSELHPTPAAHAVWEAIGHPAGVPRFIPLGVPITQSTVALLPAQLRESFGFDWGPARARLYRSAVAVARQGIRVLPPQARYFPEWRRAQRRWAGAV